jgi:hypothetical protein
VRLRLLARNGDMHTSVVPDTQEADGGESPELRSSRPAWAKQ